MQVGIYIFPEGVLLNSFMCQFFKNIPKLGNLTPPPKVFNTIYSAIYNLHYSNMFVKSATVLMLLYKHSSCNLIFKQSQKMSQISLIYIGTVYPQGTHFVCFTSFQTNFPNSAQKHVFHMGWCNQIFEESLQISQIICL